MSDAAAEHSPSEPHADNRTYVGVAAVLAVLTALEVMIFYIPAVRPMLVPLLLVLMVAKFALVVLFFMHLKFDSNVFSGLFSGPLLVSTAVVLAMLALFGKLVGG
jgi:cytochrome c oxidase subunit 4